MIRLERYLTPEVVKLRLESYAKYNWIGVDLVDLYNPLSPLSQVYINYYEDDKVIGSCRVNRGHIPASRFFPITDCRNEAFELCRLNVEDCNPLKKYKIVTALIQKVIAICLIEKCEILYAAAIADKLFAYTHLCGFQPTEHGKGIYHPIYTNDVTLLWMDFPDMYRKNKRGLFDLKPEFIEETREELGRIDLPVS